MSRLHDDAFGLNKDNDELDNEKPSTSKCTNEEFESNLENSNIDNTGEMQRFKMLFNKHGHDLESRKASKNEEKQKKENRYAMIFNKDINSKSKNEKTAEGKKIGKSDSFRLRNRFAPSTSFHNSEFMNQNYAQRLATGCGKSYACSPDVLTYKWQSDMNKTTHENDIKALKNIFSDGMIRHDLKPYNSFTCLDSSSADGLKLKISSLTTIDTLPIAWQDLDENDLEKRLNLQISKSSKDNTRRKFRRDELVSVSDSELLFDYRDEARKTVKKCDKKSRGDSTKREGDMANRKQVQWKTEVDVIYFSSHLIPDGDRSGEVIGRVVEPLREEWEQQRKGLYTKMIDSRWVSLLKI